VFGRATPPPIDSRDRLSREFELISTLSDLKLTASVLSAPSAAMHPLQQQYNSLGAELTPLAPESAARKTLAKMLAVETEGERGLWQLELVDGFEVSRAGEGMLKNAGERKLVWYGTQCKLRPYRACLWAPFDQIGWWYCRFATATHWAGLISQGLKKPQAEARSGCKSVLKLGPRDTSVGLTDSFSMANDADLFGSGKWPGFIVNVPADRATDATRVGLLDRRVPRLIAN